MKDTQARSLFREDPLMATHSSSLPRQSHGQRSLVGYHLVLDNTSEQDRVVC